jgi:hypothetical protein
MLASNITQSTSLLLGVVNFLSPPTIQPSDQITINSYTDGYKVDTCFVYPSLLVPNNFVTLTIDPI